jgi:hypothetical protein
MGIEIALARTDGVGVVPALDPPVPFRRTQAELETGTHSVDGVSTTKRPDAISSDYLVSHSPGPVELADLSEGPWDRVWRARVDHDSDEVLISRSNEQNDGWDPEEVLFSVDSGAGGPLLETDLTFDGEGRPVFCASRGGDVWVRFFDPSEGSSGEYVFVDVGEGRNPRVVFTDPLNPEESELLVLFVRDGSVRFRSLEDGFSEEDDTEIPADADTYLERVYRGSYRVHLVLSQRDPQTHSYDLSREISTLYPVGSQEELLPNPASFSGGSLEEAVIRYEIGVEEVVGHSAQFLSGSIVDES